jgi:GTP1/Obg family GTP-binding protein
MDILNKKERYSAFIMFLVMFLITTGILIFALFFNYKLPLKENEVLRKENELMNKQFNFQKKFSSEFGKVTKMLDSMRKNPERAVYIEQNISEKLGDLNKEIPEDTLSSVFYQRVILSIQDLVNSKKDMLQVTDSKGKIEQLTRENEAKQRQIDDLIIKIQVANATARD